MNEALLITIGAVCLGAAVGALARAGAWLGVLRTFALVGVVTVVLVQLLPESIATLGAWALAAFALALVAPAFVAKAFRKVSPGTTITAAGICVEVGFLGFMLHQFAEGVALGTYSGHTHAGHDHGSLVWAIAAHTLPLTAVLIAAARDTLGTRSAWQRAAMLVIATAGGFLVADGLGQILTEELHAWGTAVVAGLLCHVILHEEGLTHREHPAIRTVDVLAAIAGAALPLWATLESHVEVGEDLRASFTDAFVELSLETAPMLLLGLVLGAILQVYGSRLPARWFNRGSAFRQAFRGIAVGAPLPLCACGVLPIAESLRKRGAGPALVVSFLIATPELGPEALTLTVKFFGWPFALTRLAAALLLAYLAGLLFSKLVGPAKPEAAGAIDVADATDERPVLVRAFTYFDELLLHVAPWTFVGLVAAAFIEVALPTEAIAGLDRNGLDILVMVLVAVPTYVCAASATPLAAVLLAKGMSPGAVLVGLLLGPATNIATLAVLKRGYGRRAVVLGIGGILLMSFGMGMAVNFSDLPISLPETLTDDHPHGLWTLIASGALGVALLAQLWRLGVTPWFSILDVGGHDPHHRHDHDHGHGQGHGHDHSSH